MFFPCHSKYLLLVRHDDTGRPPRIPFAKGLSAEALVVIRIRVGVLSGEVQLQTRNVRIRLPASSIRQPSSAAIVSSVQASVRLICCRCPFWTAAKSPRHRPNNRNSVAKKTRPYKNNPR